MEFIEELRFLKEQLNFNGKFELPERFDNVVLAGMGGSGIANRIFSEFYSEKPVHIVDDYNIPEFVSKNTLFIGASFSGGTEETLRATEQAKRKGAYIATISSGGQISEIGDQNVRIPRNDLQPRSATGYMLMPLLLTFGKISRDEVRNSHKLLADLDSDNSECKKHAERIADGEKFPVIYGSAPFKAIAYRWKTQFNENSKVIGYSSSFPELNHNDTMAIGLTYRKKGLYFLVFHSESKKVSKRIEMTAQITKADFNLIRPKGKSDIERMFYLLHYGDYITYHLSLLRGIDPTDISLIQELKKRMMD